MTGEGELFKKLKMMTSFATPYSLTDEENIKVNEIIGSLQRINDKHTAEVLDEAAKEFPCYPICSWIEVDSTDTKKILPCEDGCYNWRAWFVKWFGSE